MNSNANEQVLTALQQVVGATLKSWLYENKAEVIQALRAAVPTPQVPTPPAKTALAATKAEPQFLNTADIAARWQLHRESVRRLVRQGRLPRMFVGRRVLVPLSAILEYERQNTISRSM
ncbi:MAG TPA: helix-turn-helix domain-containing protein [Verrucomicrobiae bacterium]